MQETNFEIPQRMPITGLHDRSLGHAHNLQELTIRVTIQPPKTIS